MVCVPCSNPSILALSISIIVFISLGLFVLKTDSLLCLSSEQSSRTVDTNTSRRVNGNTEISTVKGKVMNGVEWNKGKSLHGVQEAGYFHIIFVCHYLVHDIQVIPKLNLPSP